MDDRLHPQVYVTIADLAKAQARHIFLLTNDAEGTFEDRVQAQKDLADALIKLRRVDRKLANNLLFILNPRWRPIDER